MVTAKVSGTWRDCKVHVKNAGAWKRARVLTKVSDAWEVVAPLDITLTGLGNSIDGIAIDASYFYACSIETTSKVYRRNHNGSADSQWNTHSDNDVPRGIFTDGTNNVWVANDAGVSSRMFNYSRTGSYRSGSSFGLRYHFSFADERNSQPNGVTGNGSSLWVSDHQKKVFKYSEAGGFVSYFDLRAASGIPSGIAWDNSRLYVLDRSYLRVDRYTEGGTYEATFDLLASHTGGAKGMAARNGFLYIVQYYGGVRIRVYDTSGNHVSG